MFLIKQMEDPVLFFLHTLSCDSALFLLHFSILFLSLSVCPSVISVPYSIYESHHSSLN